MIGRPDNSLHTSFTSCKCSERLMLSNASLRISTISSASILSCTCAISFCISQSDVPLMETTTFGSPSHISISLMFIPIPRQSSWYLLYCTHTSQKIKVPKIPGEGFRVRGLDQRGMVKLMFIVRLYPLIIKRSEEHTSELQSRFDLVCRLLLEKKKLDNIISKNI